MKKMLLLGSLLTAASLQAQESSLIRYYWPVQRVSEITSGTRYFIYNTANDNGDRSYFLYSDGSTLKTNNVSPKDFVTTENKYLFTARKPENQNSETHWYLNSVHGILGHGGQTNNTEIRDIYIAPWLNADGTPNTDIAKNPALSEDEDGNLQDPNVKDTHVWAVMSQSDGGSYWNGNASSAGLGSAWVTYSNAHPYAFYAADSIAMTDAANEAYTFLKDCYFDLHQAIGLVKEASQFSSNAQSTAEGSTAALIDGNYETFFHSAYGNEDVNIPGTPHYLQIDLGKSVNAFYFYSKKRSQNANNRPTEIKISVSTDGVDFTELTTLNDADLIAKDYYISSKIGGETTPEFSHVRFEITNTNTPDAVSTGGGNKFFTYSEFYVFEASEYEAYNLKNLTSLDYLKTISPEEAESQLTSSVERLRKASALQSLAGALSTLNSYTWGTDVNEYIKPANYEQAVARAEEITEANTEEEITEAAEQLNAIIDGRTLNQPVPGFYRLKSATRGNYITSPEDATRASMTTEKDMASVFYLTADKKLITSSLKAMSDYNMIAGLGSEITFQTSKIKNGYVIRLNNNSYYATETGQNLDHWGNETQAINEQPNCAWILEEVTDPEEQPNLTKEISSYATLGAPVALNVPEGVTAYTVTVSEDKSEAILTEVSGEIIPAGCGVVLKADNADNYTFTFAAGADAIADNLMVPMYAETEVPTTTNAYVLGSLEGVIGFYQMSATDRTMAANKAYLELPASASAIRSITIGGPTTGIEETVAEGAAQEEYYDLQGRRVMNPTKGIYVTKSGKKVVFGK